ncbi:MAG: M23 family metallopeptidase [Candidatus Moranbacteria bacterium]|nr:M23 family metallopeptidase [Candidatus Moranbacteria bacterium]
MKKYFIILLVIIIIFGLVFWRVKISTAPTLPGDQTHPLSVTNDSAVSAPATVSPAQKNAVLKAPLDRAKERVTKKYFGIFITPASSPVQPERFRGYHTGTDFEIFPEELNTVVPVQAICDGKLILKKSASGYGGVAVQSCNLDNQPVTVVYGHLKLTSIAKSIGDNLSAGDTLGQLGAAYSPETDGERKHLHLSIHKGSAINILGYVQNKSALSDWVDPCQYACK